MPYESTGDASAPLLRAMRSTELAGVKHQQLVEDPEWQGFALEDHRRLS